MRSGRLTRRHSRSPQRASAPPPARRRRTPARRLRPRAVDPVAAVDGDRIDPVQHDRAGRLHHPAPVRCEPPASRRSETTGRRAAADDSDRGCGERGCPPSTGSTHVRAMTVTLEPHSPQAEHKLRELALHSPHRSDVVGDDRHLPRGPSRRARTARRRRWALGDSIGAAHSVHRRRLGRLTG